jgi:hypothetical protein
MRETIRAGSFGSEQAWSGQELHEPEATDVVITLGLRH